MAMNKSTLKGLIVTELTSQFPAVVATPGYTTLAASWDSFATAIANAVIDHITGAAKCSGTDSNGDSHDSVSIV